MPDDAAAAAAAVVEAAADEICCFKLVGDSPPTILFVNATNSVKIGNNADKSPLLLVPVL